MSRLWPNHTRNMLVRQTKFMRILTPHQLLILQQVADGNSNKEIAEGLGVSEETVKTHIRRILDRTGAKNRANAVAEGLRKGWIQ